MKLMSGNGRSSKNPHSLQWTATRFSPEMVPADSSLDISAQCTESMYRFSGLGSE